MLGYALRTKKELSEGYVLRDSRTDDEKANASTGHVIINDPTKRWHSYESY
jgi:hypothetical protein